MYEQMDEKINDLPSKEYMILPWASAAGAGGGAMPSWIFIHGTVIVDRSLIVLFFGLFCYFSVVFLLLPPGRGLIVLFFGLFSVSLETFADALGYCWKI